jgi:hypothetical protein
MVHSVDYSVRLPIPAIPHAFQIGSACGSLSIY